jgi:hypothetical protein
MDQHGSYDVVAGTVTRASADPSGTVMVCIPTTTRDDEPDTLVVDARPGNVYPSEADALAAALEASIAGARRWMERAAELAKTPGNGPSWPQTELTTPDQPGLSSPAGFL